MAEYFHATAAGWLLVALCAFVLAIVAFVDWFWRRGKTS